MAGNSKSQCENPISSWTIKRILGRLPPVLGDDGTENANWVLVSEFK